MLSGEMQTDMQNLNKLKMLGHKMKLSFLKLSLVTHGMDSGAGFV
jgi:hypothetical protein